MKWISKPFSIAGTITTLLLLPLLSNESAIAQTSLNDCLNDFIQKGVSPDQAAALCSNGNLALERCVERQRYTTYQGTPRVRQDGRTEYIYPSDAFEAASVRNTQCWVDARNWFNPKNICWSSSIRTSVMSEEQALKKCQGLVSRETPTPTPYINPAFVPIPIGVNPVSSSPVQPPPDPAKSQLAQWGWAEVDCFPQAVFIMGLGTRTICVTPTDSVPAGYYRYDRASNQLVPLN